ncbi:MAG: F0F1 ATP synthase subunit gamma [Anaerolineae bacterium]|nr:F0F1 ATP synthase subunit gamma [Anaerolineae bacterium]
MEDVESALERLENIRTVEPILGALRTVSLGSWQAAIRQRSGVQAYARRLLALLPGLLPHLPEQRRGERQRPAAPDTVAVLVIGSERGLCGQFNEAVAAHAAHYLRDQAAAGTAVHLMAFGSKAVQALHHVECPPAWSRKLSVTALPTFGMASELTREWLSRYEAHALDAVDVIYNTYRGPGSYQPAVERLIPPQLPPTPGPPSSDLWPPLTVETDPLGLYVRIVEQWSAVTLHGALLNSAAAEHSMRYQMMEGAAQNAERLIDELTIVVQTARREAITKEMQELAAGAGLLGRQRPSD